nr:MAG TPA: hypothetical protein [Caudoviricetes sp.]
MLTTIDNPFDPFNDYDNWLRYDEEKGYNTCGYLARIAKVTDNMSLKEEDREIERACDEIIDLNPLGIYRKVKKEIPFIA